MTAIEKRSYGPQTPQPYLASRWQADPSGGQAGTPDGVRERLLLRAHRTWPCRCTSGLLQTGIQEAEDPQAGPAHDERLPRTVPALERRPALLRRPAALVSVDQR